MLYSELQDSGILVVWDGRKFNWYEYDKSSNNEDTVLTAIPKVRQDLVEVMRNGMNRQMEVY